MKSKKLLIALIVVAVVVVTIVVLASVFTLREAIVVCHNFAGDKVIGDAGAPTEKDILDLVKGKNIVFLNKANLIEELNKMYPAYHFFAAVKLPPDCLEVHVVKRGAVVKLDVGGKDVYLDSFGYKVAAPDDGTLTVDISSAFMSPIVAAEVADGEPFSFANEVNNMRLSCVLETFVALWRCRVEVENFATMFGSGNVFSFDSDNRMTITTPVGAKIHFVDPKPEDMQEKFIKAYSVYCSPTNNLQKNGVEITVWSDGKITTPEANVK